MVKPPQRPAPKTGAQKSSSSGGGQANKSTSSGDGTKPGSSTTSSGTSGRSSAKRAAAADIGKPDAKLTAKPTTIDLKANEPKKPVAAKAASSTGSNTRKTGSTSATASATKAEPGKSAGVLDTKPSTTAAPTATNKKPEPITVKPKTPGATPAPTATNAASASKDTPSKTEKRGGTGFLALLLAGIFGGIITLLGAFALLGSGAISGLLADKPDDQVGESDLLVGKLSQDVSGLAARLQELQSALDEVSATVNEERPDLSGPLSTIKEEISAVQAQLNDQLAEGDSDSGADDAVLTELKSQMAASAADSARKLEELNRQLSQLTNQQAALESSVSAGDAGEAPALAALEQRLTALSDTQQAQGALVPPAVREELSVLEEGLQKLAIQMAVMENLQLITEAQQTEIGELSSVVETVAQKTDRLQASVEEEPPAESGLMVGSKLDYLQGALTQATSSGVPFAGLLSEAKTFLAQHNSAVELPESLMQSATTGVLPLGVIASQIEMSRSEYDASSSPANTDADASAAQDDSVSADGVLEGLMKGAQSLVTIRSVEPPAAPAPTDPVSALLAEAESAARNGDLSTLSEKLDALAASDTTPPFVKESLATWQAQVAHHQALAKLSEQIKAVQQTIWAQASEGARP